jgi:hypothetical protein
MELRHQLTRLQIEKKENMCQICAKQRHFQERYHQLLPKECSDRDRIPEPRDAYNYDVTRKADYKRYAKMYKARNDQVAKYQEFAESSRDDYNDVTYETIMELTQRKECVPRKTVKMPGVVDKTCFCDGSSKKFPQRFKPKTRIKYPKRKTKFEDASPFYNTSQYVFKQRSGQQRNANLEPNSGGGLIPKFARISKSQRLYTTEDCCCFDLHPGILQPPLNIGVKVIHLSKDSVVVPRVESGLQSNDGRESGASFAISRSVSEASAVCPTPRREKPLNSTFLPRINDAPRSKYLRRSFEKDQHIFDSYLAGFQEQDSRNFLKNQLTLEGAAGHSSASRRYLALPNMKVQNS